MVTLNEKDFCSRLWHTSAHAPGGSASPGDRYIMIEMPKSLWRKEVARKVAEEALRQFPVNERSLVRYTSKLPDIAISTVLETRFAVFSRPPNSVLSFSSGKSAFSIFVCTDGKRDRCCAKFGHAARVAFDKLSVKDSASFSVHDCSHLGGCRYAATLVVLPSGNMYTLSNFDQCALVIEAETTGYVSKAIFRGNIFVDNFINFLAPDLSPTDYFDLASLAEYRVTDREGTVALVSHGNKQFKVCEEREAVGFGDCSRLDEGKTEKFRSYKVL